MPSRDPFHCVSLVRISEIAVRAANGSGIRDRRGPLEWHGPGSVRRRRCPAALRVEHRQQGRVLNVPGGAVAGRQRAATCWRGVTIGGPWRSPRGPGTTRSGTRRLQVFAPARPILSRRRVTVVNELSHVGGPSEVLTFGSYGSRPHAQKPEGVSLLIPRTRECWPRPRPGLKHGGSREAGSSAARVPRGRASFAGCGVAPVGRRP